MARLSTLLVLMLLTLPAHAVTIEQPLENPAQEAVAQQMFHELKCVVCTGEALAESDAALAIQMRGQIRAMAGEGKSEVEIRDYFRARYGDTILLNPPVENRTALLWVAPLLILTAGGWLLLRNTKASA